MNEVCTDESSGPPCNKGIDKIPFLPSIPLSLGFNQIHHLTPGTSARVPAGVTTVRELLFSVLFWVYVRTEQKPELAVMRPLFHLSMMDKKPRLHLRNFFLLLKYRISSTGLKFLLALGI